MKYLLEVFWTSIMSILIWLTWILLKATQLFVSIGETTSLGVNLSAKYITRHFLAVYYFSKYLLLASVRLLLNFKKAFLAIDKSLNDRIDHFVKNIYESIKRILALGYGYVHSLARGFGAWAVDAYSRTAITFKKHISDLSKLLASIILSPLKLISSFQRAILHSAAKVVRLFWKIPQFLPSFSIKVKPAHTPLPIKLLPKKRKKLLKYFLLVTFLGLATTFAYYGYVFYKNLPKPQDIGKINFALTSHVYDRNGKKLYDFYKDQNRTPVDLDNIPEYVATSTIAIEDKDFYSHRGVAPISGIARALRDWLIRNNGVQGGSTITQQLVKTALLTPERSIVRKVKEIIIALEAESIYTKRQILEMYLNQVPYGGAVYGIEEASFKYFGKPAKNLSLAEAALLAGLPQAPTDYSPFTNLAAALKRKNQVLKAMLEQGYITRVQYVTSSRQKLNFKKNTIAIEAPHFVFYVRKYLQDYFENDEMDNKGYRITTSLDLEVQNKVESILNEELEKIKNLNVTNGAILVTKPATGEVIAMVGSRNFFGDSSGEFNVTTGLRQPGSSIKPILYALAMQNSVTSATLLDDSPVSYRLGPNEVYKPVNYDGRFHGRVTVRTALANSYNIPAVKLMDRFGVTDFINFAKEMGIDTWNDPSNYGISLALGGGEVTMIDMAEGYSALANYGRRTDVNPIVNIIDTDGRLLKQGDVESRQIVSADTAYILSDILSDNAARVPAFGPRSSLEVPGYRVAVKTGTTDEKRDNWTIGYTPDYLVVVWVGNNDHTPMNPYLTSGVTGAAPIWNRVMTYLLSEYSLGQKNWYAKTDDIIEKNCLGRKELFVSGTENSVNCTLPTPTPKPQDTAKQ